VILNPTNGVYHLLNATAVFLLEQLECGATLDEAVHELARDSGQPAEVVNHDADAFINAMLDRRLLEAEQE
jgi:hypothetical protein